MPIELLEAKLDDFRGYLSNEDIGVFHNIKDDFINKMIADGVCSIKRLSAGTPLFHQGEDTRDLPIYVIVPPSVFAVKHIYKQNTEVVHRGRPAKKPEENKKQKELIVALDTYGLIGDVEQFIRTVKSNHLIMRGLGATKAKATITAMTDSTVLEIKGKARELMLRNCTVKENMLKQFALKILRRSARGDALHVYDRMIAVAVVLRRLSRDPEEGGIGIQEWDEQYVRLRCNIRQQDWSDALAVSTLSVHKDFQKLEEDGIAAYRKDGVILVNKKFLRGEPQINDVDLEW